MECVETFMKEYYKEEEVLSMPCYEINTVSVEFFMANIDFLLTALKELGYEVQLHNKFDYEKVLAGSGPVVIEFDMVTGLAKVESKYQDKLNAVKRQYSKVVIAEVAKKKRWVLKEMEVNKVQLRRY